MSTEQELISLRARIVELEERLDYLFKHFGLQYTGQPAWQDPRVISLVRQGNKIEAIKLYRELTNVGLAEAKSVIDRIEAGG